MRTRLPKKQERKEKEAMTLDEARRYIGVSYTVFRRILDSGELPFRQVGRRIIISKNTLDKWLRFEPVGANADR